MKRLLLAVIGFYRRRLSGRGPFAQVRCTFEGLESCSAYAERITRESPSAWVALGSIRRRLRRCRHLSLYRLAGGKLGWGRDYDVVLQGDGKRVLDDALRQDGECEAVRAAVGRAAARIAGTRIESGPLPLLRDAEGARRTWRRRLWTRLAAVGILAALAGVAALVGAGPLAVIPLLTAVIPAALALTARGILRRLDWLEVLAAIDGPRQVGE
jgi:putative component of membrane protein insertase Oxa1/YidC/SpoIIIJ protein YidD